MPSDAELDEVWRALVDEFGEENITAWNIFREIRDTFDDEKEARAKRLALL